MANKIEICNLALLQLGQDGIQSIDEDTKQGRACKATYDIVRQQLLQLAEWNFATKTVTLVAVDDDQDEYDYAYAYPNDCLNARLLLNVASTDVLEFKVLLDDTGTHKIIVTDEDDAVLRYTADIETTGLFSPGFTAALAIKMAMAMCPMLVSGSDPAKVTQLQNYFHTIALPEALRSEGIEGIVTLQPTAPVVEARE